MSSISLKSSIYLRAATNKDCSLIYQWRNRDEIISLSSTLQSVNWAEHIEWFNRSLESEKRFIYIIIYDSAPIGKVRFDLISDSSAEISIYIISEFTGQGLGVISITKATIKIFQLVPELKTIFAFVRNENIFSIRAFMKANYSLINSDLSRLNHKVLSIERQSEDMKSLELFKA